jgi:hypothetical protein
MNLPEFRGRARLKRDNVSLAMTTHATGRGAPHLHGTATLDGTGATMTGTYLIRQRGVADRTGTFSVAP